MKVTIELAEDEVELLVVTMDALAQTNGVYPQYSITDRVCLRVCESIESQRNVVES